MTTTAEHGHTTRPRLRADLSSPWRSRGYGRVAAMAALAVVLGFLTLYPLSMLLYGSLHSTPPGMAGEFNLDGYRAILTAREPDRARSTRSALSLAKTIPSLLLAILLAWIVARTDTPAPRHARSADHAAVLHSADPDRDGLGHARQPAGRPAQSWPGSALTGSTDFADQRLFLLAASSGT